MKATPFILFLLVGIACSNNNQNESYNEQLIRKLFNSFNEHNWKAMADCYADTAFFLDPSLGVEAVRLTKSDIIAKYAEMEQQISNIRDSVLVITAKDNSVWVEFISKGTINDSTFLYLPISTHFILKDGKVTHDNTYYSACD